MAKARTPTLETAWEAEFQGIVKKVVDFNKQLFGADQIKEPNTNAYVNHPYGGFQMTLNTRMPQGPFVRFLSFYDASRCGEEMVRVISEKLVLEGVEQREPHVKQVPRVHYMEDSHVALDFEQPLRNAYRAAEVLLSATKEVGDVRNAYLKNLEALVSK